MKSKKLLACLMAGAMVLSMAACGTAQEPASTTTDVAATTEQEETEATEVVEEASFEIGEASIDFADGNFAFVGNDTAANPAAKAADISMAEIDGKNAVKLCGNGNNIYAGIQMDALLGDAIADVASVDIALKVVNPDGTFGAVSGVVYSFLGEDNNLYKDDWSIYMEKYNPKMVTVNFKEAAAPGNFIVVSLENDTIAVDKGGTPAELYLEAITFKDASGNVLTADSSAEFVGLGQSGPDRSNLFNVTSYVEIPDFAKSAAGWAQDGVVLTEEQIAALVPGSVIEIEYSSADGEMWVVIPWAEAGWMRVGQNDDYINDSKTIAQVTYEQIAALCGDDVSKWGGADGLMLQCESSSDWEVFSVKIGTVGEAKSFVPTVAVDDFAKKAAGWAQDGVVLTEEQIAALVPGSVIKFQYTSADGTLWAVIPWAEAGWMRVGQAGTGDDAICDGSTCYVTYEQIAALCGDDVSKWGGADGLMLQAESSSDWEVYSVEIGTFGEGAGAPALKNVKPIEGFAKSGAGWAQDGVVLTEEQIAMLVPGSVIKFNYTSADGTLWAVIPWAEAGWMRVGQAETEDPAVCDGSTCYVTYEQIAALCGDDVSKWGGADGLMIQAESSSDWEVYSVSIGQQ